MQLCTRVEQRHRFFILPECTCDGLTILAELFTLAKADLIARLCDDAKKEAKIENGLEDIARHQGCMTCKRCGGLFAMFSFEQGSSGVPIWTQPKLPEC